MTPRKRSFIAVFASIPLVIGTYGAVRAAPQQGTPAPSGQPSAAPRPANPQPRPAPPPNTPSQAPAQPPAGQPGTPTSGDAPAVPDGAATLPDGTTAAPRLGRYERPFVFRSPAYEHRFNDASRRLAALEARMSQSNQALLKRLGEVRTLAPDRQNAALMDLLQQFLLDQAQLQRYLVQARSAWTGELEGASSDPSAEPQPGAPEPAVNGGPETGVPPAQPPANPPR